jgi:hypothetical protein
MSSTFCCVSSSQSIYVYIIYVEVIL